MVLPIIGATIAGSTGAASGGGFLKAAASAIPLLGGIFGGSDYSGYDHSQQLRKEAKANQDWVKWYTRQQQKDFVKNAELDRKASQYKTEEQFKWLVEGAQRAGFNPLTVLGATGGQVQGGPGMQAATPLGFNPPVTSNNKKRALQAGLESVANTIASQDPIEIERRRLENELLQKQIQTFDNKGQRLGVPSLSKTSSPIKTGQISGPPISSKSPRARLTDPDSYERKKKGVTVWLPFGGKAVLDHTIADDMKIKRNQMLTAGILSELTGEVITEGSIILQPESVLSKVLSTGIFRGYDPTAQPESDFEGLNPKPTTDQRLEDDWNNINIMP